MEGRSALLTRISAGGGSEVKDPATGEVIGRTGFAYVVSREQGKTMNGLGARFEVAGCAAWVRAAASTPLPAEVLANDESGHSELPGTG